MEIEKRLQDIDDDMTRIFEQNRKLDATMEQRKQQEPQWEQEQQQEKEQQREQEQQQEKEQQPEKEKLWRSSQID